MFIKCSYLAQRLILYWDNIPVNGRSELKHAITLSDLLSHTLHCSEWMSSILADAWCDIFKLLLYSFYYVLVCVLYRRRHRAMHREASPANGDFYLFIFFSLSSAEVVVKLLSIKSCWPGIVMDHTAVIGANLSCSGVSNATLPNGASCGGFRLDCIENIDQEQQTNVKWYCSPVKEAKLRLSITDSQQWRTTGND